MLCELYAYLMLILINFLMGLIACYLYLMQHDK